MNGMLEFDRMRNQGRVAPRMSAKRLNFAIRNAQLERRVADVSAAARYRELPNELAGILDDLKAIAKPYIAKGGAKLRAEFQDQLTAAQTKLEAKLGEFLSSGQKIVELKQRAQAQQNSPKPEVKNRAIAITAKANALQSNYEAIKASAIKTTQDLVALKNSIAASPVFNFDNPMSAGSRIVELFNQFRSQIGAGVAQSASVVGRIAAHLKETRELDEDVNSLESYAQGKGWGATFDRATSFYGDTMSTVVKIGAVGALVYLLAPSLIGRMARARS